MPQLYSVSTWDCERQTYTPQSGLRAPSQRITLYDLRRVLRELRDEFGYSCHRNDTSVLVEHVART